MSKIKPIEHKTQRVLTTAQLAELYGADNKHINDNFQNNSSRYVSGKHYFFLEGEELKAFKASTEISGNLKFAPTLYLWTEKGAWMHAKSLNTDRAWEAYEMLVDDYYRIKELSVPKSLPEALRLAADLAEKNEALQLQNAQKEQIINELQPKATYCDMVLQTKSTVAITKIAKDYGMSAMAMNALLHELGVQYKQGDCWLLYQKYADKGYTQSKIHVFDNDRSVMNTYWTQKGRFFIYALLKSQNLLPLIEREQLV